MSLKYKVLSFFALFSLITSEFAFIIENWHGAEKELEQNKTVK